MLITRTGRDAQILYEANAGGSGEGDSNTGTDSNTGGEMTLAQLQAELETMRKALKAANSESATRRKKLEEIEAAESERKARDLTEAEKAVKRAELAEQRATQLENQWRTSTIRHAVEMTAGGLNFADPDDAFRLADLAGVEIDATTGKVIGVEDALKALAKAKPHLIKQSTTAGDINAQSGGRATGMTVEDIAKRKRMSGGYAPV
jgi:hypothetical protein